MEAAGGHLGPGKPVLGAEVWSLAKHKSGCYRMRNSVTRSDPCLNLSLPAAVLGFVLPGRGSTHNLGEVDFSTKNVSSPS